MLPHHIINHDDYEHEQHPVTSGTHACSAPPSSNVAPTLAQPDCHAEQEPAPRHHRLELTREDRRQEQAVLSNRAHHPQSTPALSTRAQHTRSAHTLSTCNHLPWPAHPHGDGSSASKNKDKASETGCVATWLRSIHSSPLVLVHLIAPSHTVVALFLHLTRSVPHRPPVPHTVFARSVPGLTAPWWYLICTWCQRLSTLSLPRMESTTSSKSSNGLRTG